MERKDMIVDLRSDTVTKPTIGMRKAMMEAEVGDDVYGEDPTVRALEERAKAITGKEAAVFVCSGTMANQLAIRTRCAPGDEVLMHELSHPFLYEGGACAVFSGATIRPLKGERGLIDPKSLKEAIRPYKRYMPRQRLVCLENTHNRGGGSVWPLSLVQEVTAIAKEAGLQTHMDGARIFNASIASGVPVAEYAKYVDTISFCLSKGLGAPIGSVLCGPHDIIEDARRFRHQMGGAWRQAGVLAACGLYALDHHIERLREDHERAKRIAQVLEKSGLWRVLSKVETNIILFAPTFCSPLEAQKLLAQKGVLVGVLDQNTMRAVTHLDIDDAKLEYALSIFSGAKDARENM
jgi:threonine aldolase